MTYSLAGLTATTYTSSTDVKDLLSLSLSPDCGLGSMIDTIKSSSSPSHPMVALLPLLLFLSPPSCKHLQNRFRRSLLPYRCPLGQSVRVS